MANKDGRPTAAEKQMNQAATEGRTTIHEMASTAQPGTIMHVDGASHKLTPKMQARSAKKC